MKKVCSSFGIVLAFSRNVLSQCRLPILDEQITQMAPFLRELWEEGMRSYLIYPVQNNDGFLGLLELASPVPNQLNLDVMARLEPAMPLISLGIS